MKRVKVETPKECFAKRGYYPNENGQVMIRYNGFNYQVCKNLESAIQYIKDMFSSLSYDKLTLVYWS